MKWMLLFAVPAVVAAGAAVSGSARVSAVAAAVALLVLAVAHRRRPWPVRVPVWAGLALLGVVVLMPVRPIAYETAVSWAETQYHRDLLAAVLLTMAAVTLTAAGAWLARGGGRIAGGGEQSADLGAGQSADRGGHTEAGGPWSVVAVVAGAALLAVPAWQAVVTAGRSHALLEVYQDFLPSEGTMVSLAYESTLTLDFDPSLSVLALLAGAGLVLAAGWFRRRSRPAP